MIYLKSLTFADPGASVATAFVGVPNDIDIEVYVCMYV